VTWQGQVVGPLLASAGVDGLGAGEDVESEVAAAFGPFVVLFGEDRAAEPDDRAAVGEDADDADQGLPGPAVPQAGGQGRYWP
jgi:hypothetical protein